MAAWAEVIVGQTVVLSKDGHPVHAFTVAAKWDSIPIPGVVWLQDEAGRGYFSNSDLELEISDVVREVSL